MKFSDLDGRHRMIVARAISAGVMTVAKAANGGRTIKLAAGYEAVAWNTSRQRRPSVVEFTGEDGILSATKRNRLANLSRQAMRNGPARRTIDQQRRVNIVGTVGGKLTACFPSGFEDAQDKVMDFFNRLWAPQCEFTDGLHFNDLLKGIVTSVDTTGDIVLVFDDGILSGGSGTGRIRAFETDEIASLADADFKARYPASWTQSQGKVYDTLGRFAGVVVSTSQRGRTEFRADDGVIPLSRDPMSLRNGTNWVYVGSRSRLNQGRGVSPLAAAINCLTDIHEIAASETQAAKMNAQLVGQIYESEQNGVDTASIPDAFKRVTDDAGAEIPESEVDDTVEFSLEEMEAIGAHFDKMPPGLKMELLDTKRPNSNMPAYLDWLLGQAAATMGMTRVYSTLKAETSYTAFRGEQCLAWPTFEEAQKNLERDVCDWAAVCAIRWAMANGGLDASLPDGWERRLSWSWPKAREVDEGTAVKATREKLQIGLTTYRRELGPDADKMLAEWASEVERFTALGIPHPAQQTVAGAVIEQNGGEQNRKEDRE